MQDKIKLDSVIAATKDQVSCDLGGEAAILDIKSGIYYGLDSIGARIWNLIENPKSVKEVLDVLLQEYEVEAKRCERDLLDLLEELEDKGLIEVYGYDSDSKCHVFAPARIVRKV
jgi:hypothetical protein